MKYHVIMERTPCSIETITYDHANWLMVVESLKAIIIEMRLTPRIIVLYGITDIASIGFLYNKYIACGNIAIIIMRESSVVTR
jgi:hypothetical protein